MHSVHEHGRTMLISGHNEPGVLYISHGAGLSSGGVDWFIVQAPEGRLEQQIVSLREAGRTVIEVPVHAWEGKPENRAFAHVDINNWGVR